MCAIASLEMETLPSMASAWTGPAGSELRGEELGDLLVAHHPPVAEAGLTREPLEVLVRMEVPAGGERVGRAGPPLRLGRRRGDLARPPLGAKNRAARPARPA